MNELERINEIIKMEFPEEILLYENAGLFKKANSLKTVYAKNLLEKHGFTITSFPHWRYGVKGDIVDRIHTGPYKNWEIIHAKEYMFDVPESILRKMAVISHPQNLFILRPGSGPDPVLVYEIPFLKSETEKVCVILAEWE